MLTPETASERPAATLADRPAIAPVSVRRTTIVVGAAILLSNLAQFGWLAAGSRALPGPLFGDVLASQALYGVLQILLDSGTFFEGARRSAQGTLGPGDRLALQHARSALALVGVAAGLIVMAFGNIAFARTTWPYLLALLLLARLNVWESYGRGNAVPYGAYLGLRSLLLALVVLPLALTHGHLPAEAAGVVECVVIVVVGVLTTRSSNASAGARRVHETPTPWKAIFLIGFPALISQYMFGLPTILLGVSGSTLAAAAIGIGLRVLSGIQGLNGIAGASLYPRLARLPKGVSGGGDRAAELGLLLIVALSTLALACVAVVAPFLVRVLVGHASGAANDALVVSVAAAAASGLVMQLTLMLVARHAERRVMAAAVCGALILTTGAGTVLAVGGPHRALAMASCFSVAQGVTVLMLARQAGAHTHVPPGGLWLAAGSAASLAIVVPALTVAGMGSHLIVAVAFIWLAPCVRRLTQLWLVAKTDARLRREHT